jgi:parallel beta-helix repeat protein
LKPGIIVKSVGDDKMGKLGLLRAEKTVLDGGGKKGNGPGVAMAQGATLDGFTVTNIGMYDDEKWKKHHATQGNNQSHEHIGEPGTPGIGVIGVTCTIRHNIVHHIGYTGIAIQGVKGKRAAPHVFKNICYRKMGGGIGSMKESKALIEENNCFENFYAGIGHSHASPIVLNNVCYKNIRAGIGISEGSKPVVRGNSCYQNRRAGIGVRTGESTRPIIEDNNCYENDMAGIGSEEHASPIIRGNRCYKNRMAGIGCQDHTSPVIIDNICYENNMAGIGSRESAKPIIINNEARKNKLTGIGVRSKAEAIIIGNKCLENGKVALGIRDGSKAIIVNNLLVRTGGMPPMVAVLEKSRVIVMNNTIRGGGVAGVMVQGTADISGNTFQGNGPRRGGPPNFAVWVHKNAQVNVSQNIVSQWRHAIFASAAKKVSATNNTVRKFLGSAIVVKNSTLPTHVTGTIAHSNNPKDKPADITGPQGVVTNNTLKKE